MICNEMFIEYGIPKQLAPNELYMEFEKMKNGDIKARENIIMHNIRLVYYQVIKHFSNTLYEEDDLISIGLIGLIKSVDTFDISKNIKFSNYACRCIDNEILMLLRKRNIYKDMHSLDEILSKCVYEDSPIIKNIFSDEDSNFTIDYEKKEIYSILRDLILELPAYERKIVYAFYGFYGNERLSQREIAKKFNVSQAQISRRLVKVLKQFKEKLTEQGIMETTDYSEENQIFKSEGNTRKLKTKAIK